MSSSKMKRPRLKILCVLLAKVLASLWEARCEERGLYYEADLAIYGLVALVDLSLFLSSWMIGFLELISMVFLDTIY